MPNISFARSAFLPILGVLALFLASCQKEEPVVPPAPVEELAEASSSEGTEPQQEGESTENPAQEEEAGWVSVKVLTRDSRAPVTEAGIEVFWKASDKEVARFHGTTKEDGVCRFPVEPRTVILMVKVFGTPESAPTMEKYGEVVEKDAHFEVELLVDPAAVVGGVVLREDGEVASGVRIHAWHRERWETEGENPPDPDAWAMSDEEGRFAMGGLPEGFFTIAAQLEGQTCTQRAGGVLQVGQRVGGIELILSPSYEVMGQVVAPDGMPREGALVVAGEPGRRDDIRPTGHDGIFLWPASQIVTRSDADGHFQLSGVPQGRLWNLNVRTRDYLPLFTRIEPDQAFVDARLDLGAVLSGRILDGEGEPVAKAELRLITDRMRKASSRKGGRFSFPASPCSTDALFIAYAPGFAPSLVHVELNEQTQPIGIVLNPAQSISGVLLDSSGEPIPHSPVELSFFQETNPLEAGLQSPFLGVPPKHMPERVFELSRTLTDDQGRFRFEDLYEAEFSVWSDVLGKEKRIRAKSGQEIVIQG